MDGHDRSDVASRRSIPETALMPPTFLLEERRDFVDIQLPELRLHIDEHGPSPDVAHGVGGGDERQRRKQDLVVRLDAEHPQGHVQSGRSVHRGDRVRHANLLRDHALEGVDVGARARHPVGVEAFLDVFGLVTAQVRLGERNHPRRFAGRALGVRWHTRRSDIGRRYPVPTGSSPRDRPPG